MNNHIILQLKNSKGRIVYLATQADNGIDIQHESGCGWHIHPDSIYFGAMCSWIDNPSCVVTGEYAYPFIQFCKRDTIFNKFINNPDSRIKSA